MIKNFYKFIRYFSFDIVGGAVCSAFFVYKSESLNINKTYIVILALVVFWIYLADHLLDAYRLKNKTVSARHLFYYKYRFLLIVLLALSSLSILISILFYLDNSIIFTGGFMGVGVLVYLLLNQLQMVKGKYLLPKELVIALLYTAGLWAGVISVKGLQINWLLFAGFFYLVLANVLIYSYFDAESDERDGIISLFGREKISQILSLLRLFNVVGCLGLIILFFADMEWGFVVIMLLMNLCLSCIIWFPDQFKANDRFGKVADAVFLLPVVATLFL